MILYKEYYENIQINGSWYQLREREREGERAKIRERNKNTKNAQNRTHLYFFCDSVLLRCARVVNTFEYTFDILCITITKYYNIIIFYQIYIIWQFIIVFIIRCYCLCFNSKSVGSFNIIFFFVFNFSPYN